MSRLPIGRRGSILAERVRDLVTEAPLICAPTAPIVDVAQRLGQGRSRAVVVADANGHALGIVTDRDLRDRVVAARRDPLLTTAADVMSSPVATVDPSALAFEALEAMTRREIHHLIIVNADGQVVGTLSSDDLVLLPAEHPVLLARQIARAESPEALAQAAGSMTALARRLVVSGARAADVVGLVAELNDRLIARVIELVEASLSASHGGPPVPYCWLVFGSEGRREQTLRTDQDNGLVYRDPGPGEANACARWFGRFSDRVITELLAIGFPPCPAGAMASNPRWCQPLGTWGAYFRQWMEQPLPEHILNACMYFDLRPVAGTPALGRALRNLLSEETPRHRHFLSALAHDVVMRRAPLTFLGHPAVARRGPLRGTLDIKGAGSLQLVGAGRVWALDLGLAETRTLARIHAAGAASLLPEQEASAAGEAYGHLLHLRLHRQLDALAAGLVPDNRIAPARLSRHDAALLCESLHTVGTVQEHLRDRYRTDLLS